MNTPTVTEFWRALGLRLRHELFTGPGGKCGWTAIRLEDSLEFPVFYSLEALEDAALALGWIYPKDSNGFWKDRSGKPCESRDCGYVPGYMNMYTNGAVTLCAQCVPPNDDDRRNQRAFASAEAHYLRAPE